MSYYQQTQILSFSTDSGTEGKKKKTAVRQTYYCAFIVSPAPKFWLSLFSTQGALCQTSSNEQIA